jgi:hypothetical protein
MQQPIEDRRGEHVIAEDRAPLGHELIGRDQEAAAFVPTGDELEKEMRAASFKREVAELVDGGRAAPRLEGLRGVLHVVAHTFGA